MRRFLDRHWLYRHDRSVGGFPGDRFHPADFIRARWSMPERLQTGMTMDEVRTHLRGWREGLPSAFLSSDKTHLYYTVEYNPPEGSGRRKWRLTSDNGKLLIWGEAAEAEPGLGSARAS